MVTYSNKLAVNWPVVMSQEMVEKLTSRNACEFQHMIHSL